MSFLMIHGFSDGSWSRPFKTYKQAVNDANNAKRNGFACRQIGVKFVQELI